MLKKQNYIFLKMILYLLIGLVIFIILYEIFNIINAYYEFVYYLMIILYLLLGLCLYFKKNVLCFIIYYFVIFVFLFFRKTEPGINLNFYLFDWLKNILKNKIIFINIIGNIILFIPLGIINKNILTPLLIIILIEVSQLLLKKGIFDIVDIVLNITGALIGYIGAKLWMKIKENKMKKKT